MLLQTVFVTGASGFIGAHLVAALVRQGFRVNCLVRSQSRVSHLHSPDIELIEGDLTDPNSYCNAVRQANAVVNAAGLTHAVSRNQLLQVNSTSAGELADVCASQSEPPPLIHVSSLAAVGPPPKGKNVRSDSDPSTPVSDYGYSKLQGELQLRKRAALVPITIFRPGVVYGPRDPGTLSIAEPIYRYGVHPVVGFKTPALSLIYVEDLVQLLIQAIEHGERLSCSKDDACKSQGTYFACDDSEFPSYRELGVRFARALGCRVFVLPLISPVAYGIGGLAQAVNRIRGRSSFLNIDKIRESRTSSWACRATKARKQLGLAPKKDLDQRLKETADWLVREGWLSGDGKTKQFRILRRKTHRRALQSED